MMTRKRNKTFSIIVLTFVALLCLIGVVGCGGQGKKLSVNGYESGLVFELLTDARLPVAYLDGVSTEGNTEDKVTYKITSPSYVEKGETKIDVYESVFPTVYCDRVGEWTIEYKYGNQSITKTFSVVDTTSPTAWFSAQPYDIWTSATKKYSLPTAFYEDASKIDENSMTKTLKLNGSDVEIDALDRYLVTETGVLEYVFEISDVYGNKKTISTSWNSKDATWEDNTLDSGYLADFNELDYINTVSSGDLNAYWNNTEISEEYLDEFEGIENVLKVTAKPNSSGTGAIKFRLMDSVTATELMSNKQKIVALIYPSVSSIRVGCSVMQPAPIESKHTFAVDVIPNQWNKVVLNNAELKYGFDDMQAEIDQLQFAFGTLDNPLGSPVTFYIAGVTVADELGSPETVSLDDTTLSWSAVPNADGYEVYENGVPTRVTGMSYTVTQADSTLAVKAIANDDNLLYVSSPKLAPYLDKTGYKESDIALMNGSAFTYLFGASDTNTARTAKSVTAEYLSSYKGEKNVIKVTSVNNALGIGDIVMNLNTLCDTGVTVRYMLESTDTTNKRFLQPHSEYGVEGLTDLVADGEWKNAYLNYSNNVYWSAGAKDRIDVMFQGAPENEGQTNVIYFSIVANGDQVNRISQEILKAEFDAEASTLADGYLADFDNDVYAKGVTIDNQWGKVTGSSIAYDETFDALKIELNISLGNFGLTVSLPKAMTSGAYTLRYYLTNCLNGGLVMLRNGKVLGTDLLEISAPTDKWNTVSVSGCTDSNNIYMLGYIGQGTSTKFTLYLSAVADGNVIDKVNSDALAGKLTAEASTLESGVLADFDNEVYTEFAMVSTEQFRNANSITSEIVDGGFEGETNVLKVTTTNNDLGSGTGIGDIVLKLPKACTTGMTVKVWVGNVGTTQYLRFWIPGTQNGFDGVADLSTESGWQTVYLDYSSVTIKDEIVIMLQGGKTDAVNEIYFAFVKDGNVV